jgi:ComF family protein
MADRLDAVREVLARAVKNRCALCGGGASDNGLCGPCREDLPWLPAARCPSCALPTPGGALCGVCLRSPPAHDGVACAVAYEFPVDALVRALKYHGRLAAARPLAGILARALTREPLPDIVVPLPLTDARLLERGYNQAAEIARLLHGPWQTATGLAILGRAGHPQPQASLALDARRRNVKGTFECVGNVAGLRIALLDDVMTSGATLDEAARVLKRAGATSVRGWVVARTPRASE